MIRNFIIKNRYGKELGEVIFSDKEFEVKVSLEEEKKRIAEIIKNALKEGISTLGMGEAILNNPLKLDDPLFFDALEDVFTIEGYIIETKD